MATIEINEQQEENKQRFIRSVTEARDGSVYVNIPAPVKVNLGIQKQNYIEIRQQGETIIMRRLP